MKLLDLDCFSIKRALEIEPEILEDGDDPAHTLDSRIGTFSYRMPAEMTLESSNEFLRSVLMEKGQNIYRMKGFLAIQGQEDKFVFHSVGMLFTCIPHKPWGPEEKRECVFVIIGKHLEQKWLEDRFKRAAVRKVEVKTIERKKHHHHKEEKKVEKMETHEEQKVEKIDTNEKEQKVEKPDIEDDNLSWQDPSAENHENPTVENPLNSAKSPI